MKNMRKLFRLSYAELYADPQLTSIIIDEARFDRCMKSIVLYYTNEELDKRELTEIGQNYDHIQKSKRTYILIDALREVEKIVGISRFGFKKILDLGLNLDPKNLQKKIRSIRQSLIQSLPLLQFISAKTSPNKRTEEIVNRIKRLTSLDRLAKFCMDIVNQFDKVYSYKYKRLGKNKGNLYKDFAKDRSIIKDHLKIINRLHITADKLRSSVHKHLTQ